MSKEISRNIRLGIFVIAGLAFLIVVLYMVGSKRNLFNSTIRISAQFYNVNGLMAGNNVRFSGVNVGTVEKVEIISDSSVKATIIIDQKASKYIKKNAVAAVSTDGLMGNKLININANGKGNVGSIEEGDELLTLKPIETDEMLRTLNTTNDNVKYITGDLKKITQKVNSPNTIWSLLMDTVVADNVKAAIINLKATGKNAVAVTSDLQEILGKTKSGKGTLGNLINDTTMSASIKGTLNKLNKMADTASTVVRNLDKISQKANNGNGTSPN